VPQQIVAGAAITPDETVVEIGPGLGAMTLPIARSARRVVAVELDRDMVGLLRTELLAAEMANVAILEQDILSLDLAGIASESDGKLVVMGNLPYNISSQVLVQLIAQRRWVDRAVLMFQRELAQRLLAEPGTKAYGRITVMLRYCARIVSVMTVPSTAFYPQPKVDSEVVRIDFTPPEPAAVDEALLFTVIRIAFGKRRKTLANALVTPVIQMDKARAKRLLEGVGINPVRRPETLTPAEFVALANAMAAEGPAHGNRPA